MPRYRFAPAARPADRWQTALELDFPHVLLAIQSMWGYPELNVYFYKLMINERGERNGFPPEVWDDICLLWSLHQTIVPESSCQSAL